MKKYKEGDSITVRFTRDYDRFKKIVGNRDVDEKRVRKIMDSIKEVGYIPLPAIVNSKMEVIDGQGRIEACKRLGVPVAYLVAQGAGLEECIKMNVSSTNWTTLDYIKSFADAGNENFIRLLDLEENAGFCHNIVVRVLANVPCEDVRSGRLVFTNDQYEKALELAEFFHKFDDVRVNRRKELLAVIKYLYTAEDVDNDRLVKKIHEAPRAFESIASQLDAAEVIEEVYNRRARVHVYIKTIYLQAVEATIRGRA